MRRVFILVYEGFELLDLSGPAAVLAGVAQLEAGEPYALAALSRSGGPTRSHCGLSISTDPIDAIDTIGPFDTLLVVGGTWPAVEAASADAALRAPVQRAVRAGARVGAVCAGAFVLARAGALDGRRATTHWLALDELAARHPRVQVVRDTIYVQDGNLWTSAGATAAFDMALAMVECDHGPRVMGKVARLLVADRRRLGDHPQESALLASQVEAESPLRDIVAYVDAHLDRPLSVRALARRAGLTERTFQRRCVRELGCTASRLITERRLDRARALIDAGLPIKAVVRAVGFASEAGFRSAFAARFGAPPSEFQRAPVPPPASGRRLE